MSERLRVLQVVDGLWVGGTERSLVEMSPGLGAHGIDVVIACLRRRQEGVEHQVAPERLRFLPPGSLADQARSLRRLLRSERPALVHSSLFRSNLVSRLATAGTGVPLLNSLVSEPYELARLADPRIRWWRFRAVQAADALSGLLLTSHFHAVSENVAAKARRRLLIPSGRVTVVRRGRDPVRLGTPSEDRRRRARAVLGIDPEAPVIVTVGREEVLKGQAHLVRAAGQLAGRWPHLTVLLAGRPGGATAQIEALVTELGLTGTVRRLGHRDDVPDVLSAADVFALPSLIEGFPGAVIEAMALALPVVAADIASVREIVEPGESALLCQPGSSDDLAAALDRLLADPTAAADLGRRGREIFLDRLTLDGSVHEMADLYRRLARIDG